MKPANFQPDFGDQLAGTVGVIASMFTQRDSWKAPVRVASTAAVTLSTGVVTGATIDGVTLAEGDRVLLKNQATASQNGIYLAAASGTPSRAQDYDESSEILGSIIAVLEGTVNAGTLWQNTNSTAITVGTDAITFAQFNTSIYFNVKAYGATGDGTTVDTTAVQAAITAAHANGGVVFFPAGTYLCGALTSYVNVSLLGAGRRASTIKANANSINLVQINGVATGGGTITEVDTLQWITDLAFNANGHTGCEGVAILGAAYFAIHRCSFTKFNIGVEHYGSLQSDVHDCKFVDNATGLKYDAQTIAYYGGTIPPNRVSVSWCSFLGNTSHAIDYSGGAQLIVEGCEFDTNGTVSDTTTSAVYFHAGANNNATAAGLTFRGGWMEGNVGFAGIYINTSTGAYQHQIEDTYFPTNDATYAVAVDGSSGAQYLTCDNVLVASAAANRGIYRTGSGAYLDLRNSTGVLAGSGGTVRQAPMLDQTNVVDESQMLALRLPNLTTTQRNAIGSPTAGMLIWNTTTATLNRYDGSAWASITAGSAGTTSPLTTTGDLWGYSTTDARVPIGTTSYGLIADPGLATGVRWKALVGELLISDTPSNPLIFGDVLQNESQADLVYADP